jgi:hypothetical protein
MDFFYNTLKKCEVVFDWTVLKINAQKIRINQNGIILACLKQTTLILLVS